MEKTYTANKSTAGTKGLTIALIASLVSLPVERSNNTKNAVIPVPPIKIRPSETFSLNKADKGTNVSLFSTDSLIFLVTVRMS